MPDVIGRLAANRGATPPPVYVSRGPIRKIEAVARENPVEGCVRETCAAPLACRQARAATAPALRSAMIGIARDETRHAALAWEVDRWSQALLAPAARRRVSEARREAIERPVDAPPAYRVTTARRPDCPKKRRRRAWPARSARLI